MSESTEKKTADSSLEARHKKNVEMAQKHYDIIAADIERIHKRRDEFLKKNDERLAKLRERTNENVIKERAKQDKRIQSNRTKINESYVKGDAAKQKKFDAATKRTDDYMQKRRKKIDSKIDKHRQGVDQRRKERDKKAQELYEEALERQANRLKRIKSDKDGSILKKQIIVAIILLVIIIVSFISAEVVIPGSYLKEKEVIDDTPYEEKVSIIPSKEYKTFEDISEDQMLFNLLMEHFDENEVAVLGVMCNLKAESRFQASNLEDYNNTLWEIEDDDYTEKVNRKTIDKKDFLQSRVRNSTNGFYNDNNQWVNTDGGYGYGQYTAYDKKDDLYQFAEQWFGPGGPGENYKFNIADQEMQAHFVISLLESEEYSSLDSRIRNCKEVVDACNLWLKEYEIPYDPYGDDYFTLSFDRAAAADEIKAECEENYKKYKESKDN